AAGSGKRKFTCTANHVICTPSGERRAREIEVGEEVLVATKHYALSPDQEQLIFGGVLGDGSLRKAKNGNVSFRVGHGDKQEAYLAWKQEFLAPFAHAIAPTGAGKGFDTIPMRQLGWVHDAVYQGNGHKHAVSKDFVGKLDARAIAAWYADDGTFSGTYER